MPQWLTERIYKKVAKFLHNIVVEYLRSKDVSVKFRGDSTHSSHYYYTQITCFTPKNTRTIWVDYMHSDVVVENGEGKGVYSDPVHLELADPEFNEKLFADLDRRLYDIVARNNR